MTNHLNHDLAQKENNSYASRIYCSTVIVWPLKCTNSQNNQNADFKMKWFLNFSQNIPSIIE